MNYERQFISKYIHKLYLHIRICRVAIDVLVLFLNVWSFIFVHSVLR